MIGSVAGLVLACTLPLGPGTPASAPAPGASSGWVEGQLDDLMTLYRDLHSHPELSFQEERTSGVVADQLREAGAEVTERVGGFGVVGVMENGDGPTVLLRTDLDALPIIEQTGLPFASEVRVPGTDGGEVGVMHACGHDVHMTNLVGVARWLGSHRDRWSGTVVLIGQPAEERVGGAKAMLEDGLYERFPKPDYALALHVDASLEAGKVAYGIGPVYAGVSSVDLDIKGIGGHGAYPHNTVDPISLAATLVVDLQTIVSREIKPIEPAVVTVGSIHGGSKHNIIPENVHLQMTLRAYDEGVMETLIDGIRRRAEGLARAHKAPAPVMTVSERTPPTINDADLVARAVAAFGEAIGEDQVVRDEPVMGAEDFGRYATDGVPIFMYNLGSVAPELFAASEEEGGPRLPSIHSPNYAPDADLAVTTGIRTMTAAVERLLPPSP